MIVDPTLHDLRWMLVVMYTITVLVTLLRLYLRIKVRGWWWDDSLAFFAGVTMSLVVIGVFNVSEADNSMSSPEAFYPIILGYNLPIWSARLSILFTIIRFIPRAGQKKALWYLAGVVVLQCAFLVIEAIWLYESFGRQWAGTVGQQPSTMSISQITTALITDTLLLVAPIRILHSARLDHGLYLRLMAGISISVLATIFTIIHVVSALTAGGILAAILACVEVFVCTFVCNIYVPLLAIMVRAAKSNGSTATQGLFLSTVLHEENTFQTPVWIVMESSLQNDAASRT